MLDKFEGPTCCLYKLLAFGKISFQFLQLTFDLGPLDYHPPQIVRHKLTMRFIIPENVKSLASAVQILRLHKLKIFVYSTFDSKSRDVNTIIAHIFVTHI